MKKIIALILAITLLFSFAACSGSTDNGETNTTDTNMSAEVSFPVKVTDQLGREVTIEKKPEKIVSGYYISTSLLVALGLEDNLVGIEAKASSRPIYKLAAPQLLELPSVGTAKNFDLEGCTALNPDLVILPAKLKDSIPALEELGIKVLAVNPEDGDLLNEAIDLVAKATGTTERANELKAFNDKLIGEISAAVKGSEKPSVYLSSNGTFTAAAGAKMYQNTIIENAGGTNAAAEITDTSWAKVSYEQINKWNPDVIVIASDADYTVEDVLSDSAVSQVTAVKEKKVYKMPDSFESWDSPVPSGILGTAWLANKLHPEKYSDEAYEKAVKEFYETFYGFTPDLQA